MAAVLFSVIVAFSPCQAGGAGAGLEPAAKRMWRRYRRSTASVNAKRPVAVSARERISGLFLFVLEPEQILIAALSALPVARCSSPEGTALLPARFAPLHDELPGVMQRSMQEL